MTAQPLTRRQGVDAMWLFVLGDLFIFLAYFVIFMIYRRWDPATFLDSQRQLDLALGGINTLALLASSCLVALGVGAARDGRTRRAVWLVDGAAGCGVLFLALKALEWARLTDAGYTFAHNNFFMFFFALTGVHAFHILMGFVVLALVRRELCGAPTRQHVVEAGAVYWHMVDLVWVVLFGLLYVMR